MNPLDEFPRARKRAYQTFFVLTVILGAVQIGFAAADMAQPGWVKVALAVLPFVAAAFGYTASVNTKVDEAE